MRILVLAFAASIALASSAFGQTAPRAASAPGKRLFGIASWIYQLQQVEVDKIAASPADLAVIDYSRNGTEAGRFSPDELKAMQVKPDGRRRFVLAYLSIGEAEDYRYYWRRSWVEPAPLLIPQEAAMPPRGDDLTVRIPRLVAPGWLGRENERWRGNYHVRFWYDGWQELIMHDSDSYLNRIIDAGFDGVYLDRVDAYYAIQRDDPGAKHWMVSFVEELATLARGRKPGFIVVPQNAEELLLEPRYVAAIDGIAKEDLLYGREQEGTRNSQRQIEASLAKLSRANEAGLPVLVVEYLDDAATITSTASELQLSGMVAYFGPRRLDRLVLPVTPGVAPAQSPAAPGLKPTR
jgi:cysteinyl-tRNA synthetase